MQKSLFQICIRDKGYVFKKFFTIKKFSNGLPVFTQETIYHMRTEMGRLDFGPGHEVLRVDTLKQFGALPFVS